jgi:predicted RNA methylase
MPVIQTDKPLKPRPETDFYPTPYECALAAVKLSRVARLKEDFGHKLRVLDPGAGTGVFGQAVKEIYPDAYVVGFEIDASRPHPEGYDRWLVGDFLSFPEGEIEPFHLVIGNPPYRPMEAFVRKSLALADPAFADVILMGRLEFLASAKRAKGLFAEHKPATVHVLAQRPSFTGNGKTNAMDYAYYHWQNGLRIFGSTQVEWLNWR